MSSIDDIRSRRMWSGVLGELVGSALVALATASGLHHTGLNSVTTTGSSRGDVTTYDYDVTRVALCFGFTVGTLAWIFGHVSGSHFNPAVTFTVFLARRISMARALLYVVAQLVGSVLGAFVLKLLLPAGDRALLGKPLLINVLTDISDARIVLIEFLSSLVFLVLVLACLDKLRADGDGSEPLTIAVGVATCHLWAVPLTGEVGLNPARLMGAAVAGDNFQSSHWAYWVGPLVAAPVAALVYELVFAVNATVDKLRGCCDLNYFHEDYDARGFTGDTYDSNIRLQRLK